MAQLILYIYNFTALLLLYHIMSVLFIDDNVHTEIMFVYLF